MKMQRDRIQKLITFSPHLYTLAERKAEKLGISFPEYIRMLTVADIKEQIEELPMVDEETEKQIGKSLQALREGKYADVRAEEELDAYLKRKNAIVFEGVRQNECKYCRKSRLSL